MFLRNICRPYIFQDYTTIKNQNHTNVSSRRTLHNDVFLLPELVILLISAQDLRMEAEHSVEMALQSDVTIREKAPHGVSPENWKIGADAAIALHQERQISTCYTWHMTAHYQIHQNSYAGCILTQMNPVHSKFLGHPKYTQAWKGRYVHEKFWQNGQC